MRCLLVGIVCILSVSAGQAQEAAPPSVDAAILRSVYGLEHPVMEGTMRAFDATAYPVFIAAPAIAWGVGALEGQQWEIPYRLTLTWAATLGGVWVVKNTVRRPRPYTQLDDITSRSGAVDQQVLARDSHGFPSGHASLSFALATSWSLSNGAWYVIVPSYLWAGSVSLSRVWMGVHYPSDVLAGALLGTGVAVAIHLLRDTLTPEFLEDEQEAAAHVSMMPPASQQPPMLRVRIRLP